MDDIAGCRIIVTSPGQQDEAVMNICERYPDATVIKDRRLAPSHGYQAVHVIVTCQGKRVEVQVRTGLQHAWAEYCEKLADLYGADIKYGGGAPDVRELLDRSSALVARIEKGGPSTSDLDEQLSALLIERAANLADIRIRLVGDQELG